MPQVSSRESVAQVLPFLKLQGEPFPRGLEHGRTLAGSIHSMRRSLYSEIFFRRGVAFGSVFLLLARLLCTIMDRYVPEELREEMRGVAEGAALKYRDILLLNCFDDVINILRVFDLSLGGFACSNFVLLPQRTKGRLLHGRNLDYYFPSGLLADRELRIPRLLRRNQMAFLYQPAAGNAFLSLSWPGMVGVVSGLSAKGLSLGSMTSYIPGATPFRVPSAFLYRYIIQYAEGMGEATSILAHSKVTMGNNLMVASARDASALLFELTPGRMAWREPQDGLLVATNHFQSPHLARAQGRFRRRDSLMRKERLRHLCAQDNITKEQALSILEEGVNPSAPEDPFCALRNPGTVQSVLFLPEEGRLWAMPPGDALTPHFQEIRAAD